MGYININKIKFNPNQIDNIIQNDPILEDGQVVIIKNSQTNEYEIKIGDNIHRVSELEDVLIKKLDANTEERIVTLENKVFGDNITSWTDVKNVVQKGLASSYFNIGDTVLSVGKGNKTLEFIVIGINEDIPITSEVTICPNSNITNVNVDLFLFNHLNGSGEFIYYFDGISWKNMSNDNIINLIDNGITITGNATEGDTFRIKIPYSITLKLKDTAGLTDTFCFDYSESTWYIDGDTYPNGLSAGTYNFTVPSGYDSSHGGKTYQFTLDTTIPIGGAIRYNIDENKVQIYNSNTQTSVSKSLTLTEGSSGTALPSLHASNITVNTNGLNQTRYGLNCWKQSAARQFLNSKLENWYNLQNVFDRVNTTDKAKPGFLNNVDLSFINVIAPVYKKTRKNGVIETNVEKFFLLSNSEVYATDNLEEGYAYSYFKSPSSSLNAPGFDPDNNRIVNSTENGVSTAKTYWLRTARSTSQIPTQVYRVKNDGSIDYATAFGTVSLVPVCVIY